MFKKLFIPKKININMRNIGESNPAIIYEKGERYHTCETVFDNIKKTSFEKKGIILADFKHNCVVI